MSETNTHPISSEFQPDDDPDQPERIQAAHEVFFGDRFIRPEPQAVAELIRAGLTEADIVAAGHEKGYEDPLMDATLRDLDRCIPLIGQITDTLDARYPEPNTNFIFAARDAELLYDDFAVTHPDKVDTNRTSNLMPASMPVWVNIERGVAQPYAKRFLEEYGMTKETLTDGQTQFVVIDTGFKGTIVYGNDVNVAYAPGMVDAIQQHLGVDMRKSEQLKVELVCAEEGATDRGIHQIIRLNDDETPDFERSVKEPVEEDDNSPKYIDPSTYDLACTLQTMPRYSERYYSITEYEGRVVPVSASVLPDAPQPMIDVDTAASENHNASVFNPLGAAIVQFRVVQAALRRLEEATAA